MVRSAFAGARFGPEHQDAVEMTQAKDFFEIAARCRRLARTTVDRVLAAELKELADELTARAGGSDEDQVQPDRYEQAG